MRITKTEILLGDKDDIVQLEGARESDLVTCTYRDGNKFYPIRLTRRNWRKMIAMEDTGIVELTEMLSRVFIPYYDNPKAEYWLDRYVRLEFVEYCMYTYRPANDNTTPMDWFTQMIIKND